MWRPLQGLIRNKNDVKEAHSWQTNVFRGLAGGAT